MPIPKWADDNADSSELARVLRRVRDSIRDILENTSIEVLAESEEVSPKRTGEAVEALMYYI